MDTIMFSPTTGATRLFRSYNLAQEWFPNAYLATRPSSFQGYVDRRTRPPSMYSLDYLYDSMWHWAKSRDSFIVLDEHTYIARRDKQPFPHPRDFPPIEDKERLLWKLAWAIGDLVETPPYATYKAEQPDNAHAVLRKGFVIDLEAAKRTVSLCEKRHIKLPKQAVAIARRLVEEQFDFYTMKEMQRFMSSSKTLMAINTKQDPWRIFRYYRKALIDNKVLVDNSQ